ncbi:MAG TPA: hypothetical protein VGC80_04395 [Acetobacteraceae bacterium]|jgi:hypothetical protein
MTRSSRRLMVFLLLGCTPAAAETLQCRSINGNVTCAGDGAVSCQTVNGRTVCTGSGGSIVQEFGGAPSRRMPLEADEAPEERQGEHPQPRARRLTIEQHGPAGFRSIERDGTRLRLRTEQLSIDRD